MLPPQNLRQADYLLAPADLPGLGRFWAAYERLDTGGVIHGRFLGVIPGIEGETAEALLVRATETFGVRGETK